MNRECFSSVIKSRECQHFPFAFRAIWLVDDSAAVVLRHVWTRDRMMSFLRKFQVVLLLFILMSILSSHGCYMCSWAGCDSYCHRWCSGSAFNLRPRVVNREMRWKSGDDGAVERSHSLASRESRSCQLFWFWSRDVGIPWCVCW